MLQRLISRFKSTARIFGIATALLLTGCATTVPPNVRVVEPFDANRYLGLWYEIARLDHSFERNLDQVTATYSLNADQTIAVLNRGFDTQKQQWREADGTAKFLGARDQGALKVSFFWPFYGGYFIVALDPEYQWSMVVGPDLKYFWLLSRQKTLPQDVTSKLLKQAQDLGVDVDQLIWVKQ
jgi:apolipoprotein D and lipocalin family protein